MKVAVSIPDPVFAEAEVLAKRLNLSRSKLYARALNAFVDGQSGDRITAAINAALDGADDENREFVREAARQALLRTEW